MMAEEPTQLIYDPYANENREVFLEIIQKLIDEHANKWVLITEGLIVNIFDNMYFAIKYARVNFSGCDNMIAPIIVSNKELIISIRV